jgi:xanthine dehydrogenase accessory factor
MPDIYQEILNLRARGECGALATVVDSGGSSPRKPGAKMLIKVDGSFVGTVGGGLMEHHVCEKARQVIRSGQSSMLHFDLSGEQENPTGICGGWVDVFVEPIAPPESLFVLGAGHIGAATATIGKMLGFHTVVIDPRNDLNNPVRFPTADLLVVQEYSSALPEANFDENSYVVICTNNHAFDEQCLKAALLSPARYVGMVSSKRKAKEMKTHLLAAGVVRESLDRMHAPIGLDIGAETPEEIAISIAAQIVQIRRGQP